MKTFIQLIILFSSSFLFAQNYTLTGEVMEQNKALPYVDITLSNQDTIINLTTDELGKFAIEAKKNTYKFEINYFEEIVFQKDIQLNNSIDLGNIV